MSDKENENELDSLAESFFKQIGMEDFGSVLDFAKTVEADVKERDSKLPPVTKEMNKEDFERILKEKEDKINEFENKIAPALVMFIKKLKDENRELLEKIDGKSGVKGSGGADSNDVKALKVINKELLKKIEIKEKRIKELTEKISKFKSKNIGLKEKWL